MVRKTDKNVTKKIQKGRYKGKTIKLPPTSGTRSSKSIMIESLFNTLQFEIKGVCFVELFGGSGCVGLEALSVGAKKAYFFEKDKVAFHTLQDNCKNIAPNDTTCIYGSTFEILPDYLMTFTCRTFFYVDPPFSTRKGFENIYKDTLKLLAKIPKNKDNMLIIEHMTKEQLPKNLAKALLVTTCKNSCYM